MPAIHSFLSQEACHLHLNSQIKYNCICNVAGFETTCMYIHRITTSVFYYTSRRLPRQACNCQNFILRHPTDCGIWESCRKKRLHNLCTMFACLPHGKNCGWPAMLWSAMLVCYLLCCDSVLRRHAMYVYMLCSFGGQAKRRFIYIWIQK